MRTSLHSHCQHRVSFMLKITLALNWRIGSVFCRIKMPKIGHNSERKIDWEELRNVTDYSSIDLHKQTIYRLDQWQCPHSTVDSRLIRLRLSRGFIRAVSPSYSDVTWDSDSFLSISNSGVIQQSHEQHMGRHVYRISIQALTDFLGPRIFVAWMWMDIAMFLVIAFSLGQVISPCSPCISASATAGLVCARLAGQTNLIKTLLVTPQQDYTPAIRPAPAPEQFLIQLVTFAKFEAV